MESSVQPRRPAPRERFRQRRFTTMAHSLSAARASAVVNRDSRIIEADEIEKRLAALEQAVSIRSAHFASPESLLLHS